ncbi:conserved hypothetical protein [Ferroglobus placidus DSM 10642]|uniref:Uncharacterized protein n=1 Tax=Ferroglobus placidus (strain DSM 10642 / AEDII12DO) TaxID=589924 RepID=D3S1M3_FERPA|nr:hypothetical protein [Ferroglobus placidus]ADC66487.1 conserved hypothetical protein [Ferroglobus placidus DSM 10642]
MEIKIKVPPNVSEEVAKRIAEIVVGRIDELRWVNELLKNSELTEDDAVELGRKAKKGRGEYLEKRYISGG